MSDSPRANVLELPSLDDREALLNLVEALRIAESAARQMAFYTGDLRWVMVSHNAGLMAQTASALGQAAFHKLIQGVA